MPTLKFRGPVTPTGHRIELSEPLVTTVRGANWPTQTYAVTVYDGLVAVTCNMNGYSEKKHLGMAINRSQLFGQSFLNMTSFVTGTPYRFMIDEGKIPGSVDDKWQRLAPEHRYLAEICTVAKVGDRSISELYNLIVTEPNLILACDDMIRALENVFIAKVNCARVIDGLKNILSPGTNRSKQWETLRISLNLGREYIEFVMKESKHPRHGSHVSDKSEPAHEVIYRTWIIMNRFLELKKRGIEKLPDEEFPLITSR